MIDISKIITKEEDEPYVMADTKLACYLRQYDSSIRLYYGRGEVFGYGVTDVMKQIMDAYDGEVIKLEDIYNIAKEAECDMLIIPRNKPVNEKIDYFALSLVGENEHYSVYRIKE